MAPLVTLLATFVVARAWVGARRHPDPAARAARIALGTMLVLTGIAHFTSTEAMVRMVPPFLPARASIIYATGVLELGVAAALFARFDRRTPWLGWALAAFFVTLLPANIYSAVAETGLGGHGAGYLWFRLPLQGLFIGWALAATGALPARPTTLTSPAAA